MYGNAVLLSFSFRQLSDESRAAGGRQGTALGVRVPGGTRHSWRHGRARAGPGLLPGASHWFSPPGSIVSLVYSNRNVFSSSSAPGSHLMALLRPQAALTGTARRTTCSPRLSLFRRGFCGLSLQEQGLTKRLRGTSSSMVSSGKAPLTVLPSLAPSLRFLWGKQ